MEHYIVQAWPHSSGNADLGLEGLTASMKSFGKRWEGGKLSMHPLKSKYATVCNEWMHDHTTKKM